MARGLPQPQARAQAQWRDESGLLHRLCPEVISHKGRFRSDLSGGRPSEHRRVFSLCQSLRGATGKGEGQAQDIGPGLTPSGHTEVSAWKTPSPSRLQSDPGDPTESGGQLSSHWKGITQVSISPAQRGQEAVERPPRPPTPPPTPSSPKDTPPATTQRRLGVRSRQKRRTRLQSLAAFFSRGGQRLRGRRNHGDRLDDPYSAVGEDGRGGGEPVDAAVWPAYVPAFDRIPLPKRRWGDTISACIQSKCSSLSGPTRVGCIVERCHSKRSAV